MIGTERLEPASTGRGSRFARSVVAALVIGLPAELIVSEPAAPAMRYALAWLTLACGGLLLGYVERRQAVRDWPARRRWITAATSIGLVATSAGVLSGWIAVADAAAQTLVAVAAATALAAVLVVALAIPALRRHDCPGLASTPLAWAVMCYTLMYAAGSGLGAMVRWTLDALLSQVQPGTPLWLLAGSVSIELIMLLCIVALVPLTGDRVGLDELGFRRLSAERVILVGVAVAGVALMSQATSNVVATLFGVDPALLTNARPVQPDATPSLLQAVGADAVAPGVIEEVFLRGALFGLLVRARQPVWLAVLVSSGLFALGHLTWDMAPVQMVGIGVPIFISGSIFAATYRLTGSLLPGMLAHTLNNLPVAASLALGADTRGEVGAVVVAFSVFAWLLLANSAGRGRSARAAIARSRAYSLGAAVLRHLSARARIGVVEVVPVTHVALIAGTWVFGLLLAIPDALGFSMVVYGLFACGRLVSEGARTAVGLSLRGALIQARLAPLLQVEFSESVRTRSAIAAAGVAARTAFGLMLLALANLVDHDWSAGRAETATLVGWLYVEGGLLSVLPLPDAAFDGAQLWGRTWAVRPSWLECAVVVVFGIVCVALTAVQYPSWYIRAWLTVVAQPVPLLVVGVWVAAGVVVMSRMKLLGSGQSTSRSGGASAGPAAAAGEA